MQRSLAIVLAFCAATQTARAATSAGGSAAGALPAGLPSHLGVGLFESNGKTWMKSSGVPWDVRYEYLVKGWSNNWGYGAHDGSYALSFMQEADAAHFIPAFTFYQMNGEPGGAEAQFFAKTQNATTMAEYFGDFKLLLQRCKDFGKPVVIHVEPDGFAFLEQQTANNTSAYAAVSASGIPELAGLPDTVAGWGLAFLQLRKAVGANNVILAVHVSAWASGADIATGSTTTSLQPDLDKVFTFLSPLGLSPNPTGATWDLLAGDPLDRDADYYRLTSGSDKWWDPADTASVNSQSFNRYASWLQLWNQKAGKRWMLWQIPIGNSSSLDVYNNGAPGQGYRDNRAEYFFGGDTAHAAKFMDAGVVLLLFGAGASGQSTYTNDTWSDGTLFLKTHVGQFYAAGGIALGGGGTPPPPPVAPPSGDLSVYNFESGTQGWSSAGGMITGVAQSAAQAFAGTSSLAVSFGGTGADTKSVRVSGPTTPAGRTVTFHVWIPAGSTISSVQGWVQQGSAGGWKWTGNWQPISALKIGAWNTISVQVPTTAVTPLSALGVQFSRSASWSGTAYVDAVSW